MAANSLQPTPQRRFSFRQLKGGIRRRKSLVVAKRMPTPCSAPNPETPRPLVLALASALVLDRLSAAGRPDLAAVHFAGVGVGMVVSAVLVSGLAAWGDGWRSLWLASGLTSVFAVGIVAGLIADRIEPAMATPS